ncbi:MAG: ferritin-like domain-containing protein [Planctomycetota bacterium]|jgi:bacterioferritin (cytochrome b1)
MSNTINVLNRLLHDTVNSVIQYAEISAPYIPKGFDEQAATLQSIADEEKALANEVVALIGLRDGVPQVGIFDYWNVDLNYLDLRWMAGFAMEHQAKSIERLESQLGAAADDPEVSSFLRRALEQKKDHLKKLESVKGDYGNS